MKYCVSQFLLAHLSLTKRMCIFGCYIKICSSSTLLHRPFALFPLCSVPNWNEVILRYFRITYYAVHPDVYGAHLGNIYIATQLLDSQSICKGQVCLNYNHFFEFIYLTCFFYRYRFCTDKIENEEQQHQQEREQGDFYFRLDASALSATCFHTAHDIY